VGSRLDQSDPPSKEPDRRHLKGASRLVNPPEDAAEILPTEEDEGERDYLGRILRVADEALRHVKQGILHRPRRGRIH
jgi:hypothetical protein